MTQAADKMAIKWYYVGLLFVTNCYDHSNIELEIRIALR
jgi:hypothetical protein